MTLMLSNSRSTVLLYDGLSVLVSRLGCLLADTVLELLLIARCGLLEWLSDCRLVELSDVAGCDRPEFDKIVFLTGSLD